ncbi:low temperature requirement protein A [Catellatospora sp. KI3]|uniref:low temperature requirement protein A n=1 Tax=Catellatospora sp. KI3 TaxID=3041620 RepID=UPI002482B346|nr:low temperature requirement protein A [Catellatospora sp. KI3]MDI1463236.1 low temperature requirement protein A [Catellatospora sp. KI3]
MTVPTAGRRAAYARAMLPWVRRRAGVAPIDPGGLPTATELFLDVVFVLAVAQVAAVLAGTTDPATTVRGFAVLLAVLMYWTGLVLAGSVVSAERAAMRPVIVGATVSLALVAVTAPDIVADGATPGATVFAASMLTVQALETAGVWMVYAVLPAHRLHPGNAVAATLAPLASGAMWFAAAATTGQQRTLLLVAALAINVLVMGALQLDFRDRLPFGATEAFFPRATAVFTDRVAAVVVVALGCVVELLGGLDPARLGAGPVLVYLLVYLTLLIALWWLHFGFIAGHARIRFRAKTGATVRAAALFTYFQANMVMLVGLVLLIVGLARTLTGLAGAAPAGPAAVGTVYGGVTLYLLGQFWFWAVIAGRRCWLRPATALLLLALTPVAAGLPLPAMLAIPAAACTGLAVADSGHCRAAPQRRVAHRRRLAWRLRLLGRYNTARAAVTDLELLVDVVAGFAVTRTAYLVGADPHPAGMAQAVLVLLMLWGCWSATTRLANTVKADLGATRACLLAAMAALLLLTLAAPQVFTTGSARVGAATVVFALAYLLVRALTAVAVVLTLRPPASRLVPVLASTALVTALILTQAAVPEPLRPAAWSLLAATEIGTWWAGSRTCPVVAAAHLVERHSLMTLLGLASLATAITTATFGTAITTATAATAAVAMLMAAGLWHQYARWRAPAEHLFTALGTAARHRLATGRYTACHLLLLTAVIGFCYAVTTAVAVLAADGPRGPLPTAAGLALLLGVAVYQAGLAVMAWAVHRYLPRHLILGVVAPVLLAPAAAPLPGIAALALAATTVGALVYAGRPRNPPPRPRRREPTPASLSPARRRPPAPSPAR